MRRGAILLAVWLVALVAFTMASGLEVPPERGIADPRASDALGAGQLHQLLHARSGDAPLLSLSPGLVGQTGATTLVVVGPERAPYDAEADALNAFVEDGGQLVLFIASDLWNGFLARYGVTVHGNLLIPAANATAERLVTVELPDALGGGTLFLANATALVDPAAGVVAVASDQDLVLDVDGNGTIEVPPDRAGTFPVVALAPSGAGRVVVVASVEAVLGPGVERNLDGAGRLFSSAPVEGPLALDAGTHPRGWADAVRAPAQASLALFHLSPPGAAVALLAVVAVLATTRGRAGARSGRDTLDAATEATAEVMRDRAGRP